MPTPCIVLLSLARDLKDFAPIKKFILAKPLFILFCWAMTWALSFIENCSTLLALNVHFKRNAEWAKLA